MRNLLEKRIRRLEKSKGISMGGFCPGYRLSGQDFLKDIEDARDRSTCGGSPSAESGIFNVTWNQQPQIHAAKRTARKRHDKPTEGVASLCL